MKRRRNEDIEEEFTRQKTALNSTFKQWVFSNNKANPNADWQDGILDYLGYAIQLENRFNCLGSAYSFGTGDCGQLGHGVDEGDRDMFVLRPRKIDTLKDHPAHAITCGGMHNGVVSDGVVWTWGCGDNDCLGREGDENYPAPVESLRHTIVIQLSMGDCHSVALDLYGRVYIWGTYKDKDGKNFFPSTSYEASFAKTQLEPYLIEEPSDVSKHGGCRQVCSGSSHTLALCGDGTVYSWGIGDSGQLGRTVCDLKENELYRKKEIYEQHLCPQIMQYADMDGRVNNARYIAAGNYHSFIIQAVRSRVFGCGLNQYCQLGISGKNVIEKLTLVNSLDNVLFIYGGEHSSLAVTHDGDVLTFGRADNNQLGVAVSSMKDEAGSFTAEPQLVKFDPPANIVAAACGSFHCMALSDEGKVYSWGFGEMGQLGHGKEKKVEYPHDEKVPKMLVNIKTQQPIIVSAISAGAQHSAVLVKE